MTAKTFEVRDKGTFVPVLAIKLEPGDERDRYLLMRAGYGQTAGGQAEYVQLCRIDGGRGETACDPYDWPNRSMQVAHDHLIKNFDELPTGAVIDVEFILGLRDAPRESEAT